MVSFKRIAAIVTCLAMSGLTFAHGENLPGPHGGAIRMPGIFHTEMLPVSNGFKIMLLDLQFANPSTRNSSVTANLVSGMTTVELKCQKKTDYFLCYADKQSIEPDSELQVTSVREKAVGKTVSYPLQ